MRRRNGRDRTREIFTLENMERAFLESEDGKPNSTKKPGIDNVTPQEFQNNYWPKIKKLRSEILSGEYKMQKLKPVPIPKEDGTYRIICIPTVRDRLVQRVLNNYLKKITIINVDTPISYGTSKKKSVPNAVKKACELRNKVGGALKTDITSFFDNIPRKYLKGLIPEEFREDFMVAANILDQAIDNETYTKNGSTRQKIKKCGIQTGKGLRQGMPLSPLLSNAVLHNFDRLLSRRFPNSIRMVDDMAVFCSTKEECHEAEAFIRRELCELGLSIPDMAQPNSKTKIISPKKPLEFLGKEIVRIDKKIYGIQIPQYKQDEIFEEIAHYGDLDYCLSKGLTYAKLHNLLENKKNGYKGQYQDCRNYREFLRQFKIISDATQRTVLSFMERPHTEWTDTENRFMGLLPHYDPDT